jgi:hypothetical protein
MRTIAALLLALTIDAKELQTLLDGIIPAEMAKQQIPGAAFILVQNGRVVRSRDLCRSGHRKASPDAQRRIR